MARHRKKVHSPVSVIVTVLNEERTIEALLDGLRKQTVVPERVVIIDGGSTDNTLQKIQNYSQKVEFELVSALVPGNRSVGRNAAIELFVSTPLVGITDAGCIPRPNWLDALLSARKTSGSQVIAGYYDVVKNATDFQLAVAPFFLVMPDQVKPKTFLPATRSMLLEKTVWQEVGGFDENLDPSEDFAFAQAIRRHKIKMSFAHSAIVDWQPPTGLGKFWRTICRMARGDVDAGIFRPKIALVFARYAMGLALLVWQWEQGVGNTLLFVVIVAVLYSAWVIGKLGKYAPLSAKKWLPILQVAADLGVMVGVIAGLWKWLFRLLPAQE